MHPKEGTRPEAVAHVVLGVSVTWRARLPREAFAWAAAKGLEMAPCATASESVLAQTVAVQDHACTW